MKKKLYIAPDVEVVKIQHQTQLLAGSDPQFDINEDEEDGGNALAPGFGFDLFK